MSLITTDLKGLRYYLVATAGGIMLILAGIVSIASHSSADTNGDNMDMSMHCQHFPADCKDNTAASEEDKGDHSHSATTSYTVHEPGQGMFGALSEINTIIEKSDTSWKNVDLDRLWEHLRDMDALMTGTNVSKATLPNGLSIRISGEGSAKRAMDNMLPAHTNFMRSVRPEWTIKIEPIENEYELTVTASELVEIQRIQALGFSGFMVQDDHHASHHMGLALGKVVH